MKVLHNYFKKLHISHILTKYRIFNTFYYASPSIPRLKCSHRIL